MILRKPYAFLIKHFRLIHTILTICMAYLVYKNYSVYSFLGEFLRSGNLRVNPSDVEGLFTPLFFIVPFLIILILTILLVVMIRKDKPMMFYITSIIVSIFSIVMYKYSYDVIFEMQVSILATQLVKLVQDLLFMMTIAELGVTVFSTIRSLGLDLEKFDFGKDLLELDISEEDNEEFEVSFNLDLGGLKRDIKKNLRYISYIYVENRFKINLIIIFTILLSSGLIIYNLTRHNNTTLQYNSFSSDGIAITVKDCYVVVNDYKGDIIFKGNDKRLIVLNVSLKSNGKNSLNTAKTILNVGGKDYYPTNSYDFLVSDLGNGYNGEKITDNSYILVYEIPAISSKSKIIFKYITGFDEKKHKIEPIYMNVNLNVKDIDTVATDNQIILKEEFNLNDKLLKDTKLILNSIEVNREFKNTYNYCLSTNECYSSIEYIKAPLNSNKDKAVLKIDMSLIKDSNVKISSFNNLPNIINSFGSIVYRYNDNEYKIDSLKQIEYKKNVKKNVLYFEVPEELMEASQINFNISVRNINYNYAF